MPNYDKVGTLKNREPVGSQVVKSLRRRDVVSKTHTINVSDNIHH